MRAGRVWERLPAVLARGCDGLLDFAVLAFAAWTVVYHACLLLDVEIVGAFVAWAALLVAAAWFAFRHQDVMAPIPEPARAEDWPFSRVVPLLCGFAIMVGLSAAVFAFARASWALTWFLLFVAAMAGLVLTYLKATGRLRVSAQAGRPRKAPGAFVAFAWAGALAAFSLFLVTPDADDARYVHLSTWIAERGEFPLRDTLFSDQVFRAIVFPPLSSFEALIGTVAGIAGVSAVSVTYLLVPPLATTASVLAVWRLLRNWRASIVGLALSTTMVFLLVGAQEHRTLGSLFVGRIWQGSIVFLAVLVPLLFVLLQAYAKQPTVRQVVFLLAAGAAGVGLTSSATFLVPVLAAGCLAPLALRSLSQTAIGLAAASAYPLGSLAVTALADGRRAVEESPSSVVTNDLARVVLGDGLLAFIAVAAALVGPFLIPSRRAALMVASTVALVAILYVPPLPPFIWEVSGIGRVLWRLVWVVPAAALVGATVTALPGRVRSRAWRAAPAVLLCAVLLIWGSPVWDAGSVNSTPSWKRPPGTVPAARRILAQAEQGDTVLAPEQVAQTLLIMSSDVTTVSPRVAYTRALEEPEAHVDERLLLQSLLEPELVRNATGEETGPAEAEIGEALQAVGVDVACVDARTRDLLPVLEAQGYTEAFKAAGLTCVRTSA